MSYIRKFAHSLEAIINRISRVLNIIGIVFLAVLILLTVADVFMRWVFARPIVGTLELTSYLMAIVGFFGLAWCAAKVGHARVDLLVEHFPIRVQAVLDGITYLMGLTVTVLTAWQGIDIANYMRETGKASLMLGVPAYPFYLVMGVGFIVLSLVLIELSVKSIIKGVKG
jgi:TRAP-type C4-dicarboxylate transport system permease small subunit